MTFYHQITSIKRLLVLCLLLSTLAISLQAEGDGKDFQSCIINKKLAKYKEHLEFGTYENQDWSKISCLPKSRYDTFLLAFTHFAKMGGKQIVQLGISPLYTNSEHCIGQGNDNHQGNPTQKPNSLFFIKIASSCLMHLNPIIYTVDTDISAANRCKKMMEPFNPMHRIYIGSTIDYLNSCSSNSIDMVYIDTTDLISLESSAIQQLEQAKLIVEKNLLTDNGIIIINDVHNQNAIYYGDTSGLGCSRYAIPYFLCNGFEVVVDEYQMILKKSHH